MLADYPIAAAYLAALPEGLYSHGECKGFECYEGARREVVARIGPAQLHGPLASLLGTSWSAKWIAEVSGLTAQMMLVDQLGEAAYLRWVYADAHTVFDRPFVRHLMRLLSPSLVVMGGASRWGAMHAGTSLYADQMRTDGPLVRCGVELSYPVGLFPASYCRALGEVFRAALDTAHASCATAELLEHGRTLARFELAWAR